MKYFFSAFFLVQENRAWRMTRWWGKKRGDYALFLFLFFKKGKLNLFLFVLFGSIQPYSSGCGYYSLFLGHAVCGVVPLE